MLTYHDIVQIIFYEMVLKKLKLIIIKVELS